MKKTIFKNPLLKIGIVVMTVSILFFSINATQIASNISNAGFGFFASVRYTLFEYPIQTTSTFFNDFRLFLTQRDQERITQQEIDALALYKAELEEAYRQIAQLKQLNELQLSANEYKSIAATVIYRPSDTFLNKIVLNVGENDGVLIDSAVITNKGLIGKIESVSSNQSIVRLLTVQNQSNRVAVKIQVSPSVTAEAIIQRYVAEKEAFEVTLLDTNVTINEGNTVITSGLGGVFPAGLLVGKVSSVEQMPNSIAVTVFVEPSADFYSFDYAVVVFRSLTENLEQIP